jgi:hypothetical protein
MYICQGFYTFKTKYKPSAHTKKIQSAIRLAYKKGIDIQFVTHIKMKNLAFILKNTSGSQYYCLKDFESTKEMIGRLFNLKPQEKYCSLNNVPNSVLRKVVLF